MKVINRAIEVITRFNANGDVKPERFKVAKNSGDTVVVNIDRIVSTELEKLAGNPMLVFDCISTVKDRETRYILKFELRTCKWVLFKI